MTAPATDPDAVAAALVAVLTPGGVPVGTLGAVVRRTPDAPYGGATPILLIRPVQDVHDWVTQLDAHRSLDGAITALGPYESTYNPDGVEVTWDNGPWIGMSLVVQYTGPKMNMPPTGA
jgi:hypothetical protein